MLHPIGGVHGRREHVSIQFPRGWPSTHAPAEQTLHRPMPPFTDDTDRAEDLQHSAHSLCCLEKSVPSLVVRVTLTSVMTSAYVTSSAERVVMSSSRDLRTLATAGWEYSSGSSPTPMLQTQQQLPQPCVEGDEEGRGQTVRNSMLLSQASVLG